LPVFSGQKVFVQWLVNDLELGWPIAFDQGQIGFASLALSKLVLQVLECAAFFGHQQNPTGVAVQSVH
jgi:hypothetical protein